MQRKTMRKNSKYTCVVLNSPVLDFLTHKINAPEFPKIFFTLFVYITGTWAEISCMQKHKKLFFSDQDPTAYISHWISYTWGRFSLQSLITNIVTTADTCTKAEIITKTNGIFSTNNEIIETSQFPFTPFLKSLVTNQPAPQKQRKKWW